MNVSEGNSTASEGIATSGMSGDVRFPAMKLHQPLSHVLESIVD